MPKSIEEQAVDELSYEEAYSELERIVTALETGDQTLETSLALFERGQVLIQRCKSLLDQAELKVRQVSGDQIEGFDLSEES
jgi:exodeoxyribonuclease VII small subunit